MKETLKKDICWDEIVKIEEIEPSKYVYDFSVPGTENFMNKDGIFVHNSVLNRMFGYICETYRFKLISLVFVLPDLAMLSVNARRVLHCLIRTYDRGLGYVYKIKSNMIGEQWLKRVGILANVSLPSKKLWSAYEKKKQEMFEVMRRNIEEELIMKKAMTTLYTPKMLMPTTKEDYIDEEMGKIDTLDEDE